MEKLNEFSVRVKDGELIRFDGKIIEDPALILNGYEVLRYGDFETVNDRFEKLSKILSVSSQEIPEVVMIHFSDFKGKDFTKNDICYILRRCSEYHDVSFVSKFKTLWGTDGFLDWFKGEEKDFPIEVEA